MASTWSALKIELLETGANSGTWGTATNVNLGDAVLGEVITGSSTVVFLSAADFTLTLTNSATSQPARNLRLNITESGAGIGYVGNLILGSNCQIEKFYLIRNDTTGAKTIKNTTGTGVAVAAGKATLVYNDGTNVVDVLNSFSSAILGAENAGSIIPFYFSSQAAFPSAATYHGAIAHSHADGAMYFAHNSVWVRMLDENTDVTVAQGGTGLSTLTANNVILGNGTSSPLFVAPSTSGNVLTSNGTTWSSSAPAAGGIVYTAVKTANYTAVNNDGVLTNTTGGAFTVTLPTSPSVGNIVVVVDSLSQWGTNNLTVDPTALIKIAGNTAGDTLVCDITGATVTLVYTGATYGWNVSAQVGGNGGTAVTLTGTQTLTNKTLTAPVLTSPNITTALTLTSASGTSGDVLTSAGSGNAPTWTTPGSGALTLLSTVTASTSSTVDIETTFNSTYDAYLLVATGVTISATDNFYCRMKIGGSYLSTSTYANHLHMMKANDGTYTAVTNSGAAQINVTGNLPTSTASHSIDFVMRVYTPSSTAFQKIIDWQGVTINSTPALMGFVGAGLNTGTDALTGVQFFTGGGTINAGKFRLYGIANS